MPWEVVSVEDSEEAKKHKWEVVSVEDTEKPKSTQTPKKPEKPEYLTPLNANAELQRFGLSAAPPAQRPGLPGIVDKRKTSYGVGLDGSMADTLRQVERIASVGNPGAQVVNAASQVTGAATTPLESAARAIAPSPEEIEEARRTTAGKVAYGAGSMVGELPKYIGATGAVRAGLSGAGALAARPLTQMMVADMGGTAAVDLMRDPTALSTAEGRRGFFTNQAGNLLQAPFGGMGRFVRGAAGAGIGAGSEWAMGGDAGDMTAGAILQGGTASALGGRGDTLGTLADGMGHINRAQDSFDALIRRRNMPDAFRQQAVEAPVVETAPRVEEPPVQRTPDLEPEAPPKYDVVSIEDAVDTADTGDVPPMLAEVPRAQELGQPSDSPVSSKPPDVLKAEADIKAFESGNMLNANPVGVVGSYLRVLEHRLAEPALKANDKLREWTPKRLRTELLDRATSLHEIDRVLNTPYGQGLHALFYNNQNLAHRIEFKIKNDLAPLVQEQVASGKIQESKELKRIDSELEQHRNWQSEKDALEFQKDALEMQRDTPGDEAASVLEPGKPGETREQKLAEINERLSALGDDFKFADDRTAEDLATRRDEILEASPETREFSEKYTKYMHDLLDLQVEAGLISAEDAAGYKERYAEYMPHYRIEKFMDGLNENRALSSAGDVSMSQLIRERQAGGSHLSIMDPVESAIYYTSSALRLIADNQLRLAVADLAARPELNGAVRKVNPKFHGAPASGSDYFYVRRDGKTEMYEAPKDVVDVVKHGTTEQADLVTKMLAKTSGALRAGATMYSLPFIATNFGRDVQTAFVREGIVNPVTYGKALASVLSQDATFQRFVDAGGTMSGFVGSRKDLGNIRAQLEAPPRGVMSFLKSEATDAPRVQQAETFKDILKLAWDAALIAPSKIADISEVVENVPRLAMFETGRKRGQSDMEAAYRARNITVDFRKMGTSMKMINMLVPFLNARAQGLENTRQVWATDPAAAMRRTIIAGVGPALAASLWNMAYYPDMEEQLRDGDRNRKLLVILSREVDPETGEFKHVVEIPKSEALAPTMNMVEQFTRYLYTNHPVEFGKVFTQMFSDASPVPFAEGGESSLKPALSTIVPPVLKAGLETGFNVNTYTGRPLDTQADLQITKPEDLWQRRRNDTPLPVQAVAKAFNMSSNRVNNTVGTMFGGAGRQAVQLADLAMRAMGREPEGISDSANRLGRQLSSSLLGVYPEGPARDLVEGVTDKRSDVAVKNKEASLIAEKVVNATNSLPLGKRRDAVIQGLIPYAADPEFERIAEQTEKYLEQFMDRANENTARSIFTRMQGMDEAGQAAEMQRLVAGLSAEDQGLTPDTVGMIIKLQKKEPLPNARLKRFFQNINTEARAEYVVDELMQVIASGDTSAVARKMGEWEEYGVLTPKVESLAEQLMQKRLAQQPNLPVPVN